ncbi:MAG TPA: chemotaxis protein CheW [Dongiaceae bacterium]|nr:chemotaxis protein CheW [Dongiaceae bacterium]
MQAPAHDKTRQLRTEQIILFRVSGQSFAISSASVQEVRGVDNIAGMARDLPESTLRKVRHSILRGDRTLYIVNAAVHFGLQPQPSSLVFFLRRTRTALLVEGIEKMTTMSRLQALSLAFQGEERNWYRGLTALDQAVVPVVNPEGFLSLEELTLLEAAQLSADARIASAGLPGARIPGEHLQ